MRAPFTAPARPFLGLVIAIGYVGLAVVFTWPLAARPATTMTADPFGDPLLNAWILAWGASRLPHGLAGFWDGPGFYPYAHTLAYSEHLLGISVFTAPIHWLTGNPILAYNLAVIGSSALAGIGTFLLARALTGRTDAAWLAGVAFACSPYRVPQVYHLQVLMAGWMPLALLGLHRYLATASRTALAGLVVAFVLQALSNGYFLYFTMVPLSIVAAHGLWQHRRHVGALFAPLAGAGAAALVALAPVAMAYVRVRRDLGFARGTEDLRQFAPDLAAYAQVSPRLWAWGHILPRGQAERELFPGLLVVLLALVALAWARGGRTTGGDDQGAMRSSARVYGVVLVVAVVLSLGPKPTLFGWPLPVAGPYAWLVALVPGFDGLRVPARLATVVYLALAVLAAIGCARLTVRLSPRTRRAAVALATAIIAFEGYGRPVAVQRFPTPDMAGDAAAYEWLETQPRGPMLELPVGDHRLGSRYLYRTLAHPNRVVNGYSGYGSALQEFVGGPPFDELDHLDDALAMARALGLRWIVVHPPLYEDPHDGHALVRALGEQTAHVSRVETRTGASLVELIPATASWPAPDPAWREVPPTGFRASSSSNEERLPQAFDGERTTRWMSGGPQQGEEWLEIRFAAEIDVARVRLDLERRSLNDYPRGLAIDVSADGETWRTLFSEGILPRLAVSVVNEPRTPGIDIVLPPSHASRVRFRTTGRTRLWQWSVNELRVWER